LLARWRNLDPRIKGAENRKSIEYHCEVAQRLTDFKESLIRDIQADPYTKNDLRKRDKTPVRGKIYKLENDRLHYELSIGGAKSHCNLVDLEPESVFHLGDSYFVRARDVVKEPPAQLSQRALQLAVFAREMQVPGANSIVLGCLNYIKKNGGDLGPTLDKLFPNAPSS